jgi:tRNA A37 threonylcarbamoyladenosine synthetase subunit TsaC/SUA5/YrdC
MVVTRKFKSGLQVGLEGGAHYYPMEGIYTCRPQITEDPDMVKLLEEFGPLINTSFNYHGNPIVFNQDQIDGNHLMQRKTTDITTIVVKEADNV